MALLIFQDCQCPLIPSPGHVPISASTFSYLFLTQVVLLITECDEGDELGADCNVIEEETSIGRLPLFYDKCKKLT